MQSWRQDVDDAFICSPHIYSVGIHVVRSIARAPLKASRVIAGDMLLVRALNLTVALNRCALTAALLFGGSQLSGSRRRVPNSCWSQMSVHCRMFTGHVVERKCLRHYGSSFHYKQNVVVSIQVALKKECFGLTRVQPILTALVTRCCVVVPCTCTSMLWKQSDAYCFTHAFLSYETLFLDRDILVS